MIRAEEKSADATKRPNGKDQEDGLFGESMALSGAWRESLVLALVLGSLRLLGAGTRLVLVLALSLVEFFRGGMNVRAPLQCGFLTLAGMC